MGRPHGSTTGSNEQHLRALHRAALRLGFGGQRISIRDWNRLLIDLLGMRTRQDVADKTWTMDMAGLIHHEKNEYVSFLPQKKEDRAPAAETSPPVPQVVAS